MAGFRPLISWSAVECSTTMLLQLANFWVWWQAAPGWIWTLDVTITSWVLYYSWLTSKSGNKQQRAGFEPLILWSAVECSTTVLQLLANFDLNSDSKVFLQHFFVNFLSLQKKLCCCLKKKTETNWIKFCRAAWHYFKVTTPRTCAIDLFYSSKQLSFYN